jgi:tRNA-intron endonuclease
MKPMTNKEIHTHFSKINNFDDKYLVYKDFKEKGFIVKDSSTFGFDFRIYDKQSNTDHSHTKYVVDAKRNQKDNLSSIIKSERLANNIHTSYVLAIINSENKITKIKIDRLV